MNVMTLTLRTLIAAGALLLMTSHAYAACSSPSGEGGEIVYNSSQKVFQYCDDTDWVRMNQNAGTGAGGCSNPTAAEADIIYNEDHYVMQGCAGNTYQAFGPVGGNRDWLQVDVSNISITDRNGCGIKSDHTLWCWSGVLPTTYSTNDYGPVQEENGTRDWAHVAVGHNSNCALKTDGTIWCWGDNFNGQLGDGNSPTDSVLPVQEATGATDWAQVDMTRHHACAIKTNGTLWCWGRDLYGALGNDPALADSDVPVQEATGSTDWLELSAGASHNCGIRTNGTLWCWGENGNGQLGDGSGPTDQATPVQEATGATDWDKVSAGAAQTCAVKNNGTLWCWGSDSYDSLGDGGSIADSAVPVQEATGATNWVDVDAGNWGGCGLQSDNTLWCWGYNYSGRIGDGTETQRSQPTQETSGNSWDSFSFGGSVCAIDNTGQLFCWGTNYNGGLAQGYDLEFPEYFRRASSDKWKDISIGSYSSCGVKMDDTIHCWGENWAGQLGDGTLLNRVTSAPISGGSTWKQLSFGSQHGCAIRSDDTLWCWGYGASGRLGNNSTGSENPTPAQVNGGGSWKYVSAGRGHTCGIQSDDTLWCWGSNLSAMTGLNTTSGDTLVPTQVSGGGSWKYVITANSHTCGIQTDDTLWCWGNNSAGRTGLNTGTGNTLVPTQVSTDSWESVTGGYESSCGLKTDGTIWCWGANYGGQIGDGTFSNRLVPTQTSDAGPWKLLRGRDSAEMQGDVYCAIKEADDSVWCWGYNWFGEIDLSYTEREDPTALPIGGAWKYVYNMEGSICLIDMGDYLYCKGNNDNGKISDFEGKLVMIKRQADVVDCGAPMGSPGDLIYNSSSDVMQYCDGRGWVAIGK